MKIIRAEHLGMCFGVRDAISMALGESRKEAITVLGELVHNKSVLAQLEQNGVRTVTPPRPIETQTVMITAHGASDAAINKLKAEGRNVLEATCPLVAFAHRSIQKLACDGYYPVIIGKRGHVEVRGLTGDLREYSIVLSEEDMENVPARPKIGIASQTTQPLDLVHKLVAAIRQRFPKSEVEFVDTVCQPTKQRQAAAVELARECEAVVVIGGANSNNTRQLVERCKAHCERVYHVEKAGQLQEEWFENVETVGITAGTSTPDADIREVEQWLKARQDACGALAYSFHDAI